MKKLICAALAVAVLLCASAVLISADESAEKRSGDWGYVVANGCAEIVSYYGSETAIDVPEKIDGKKVTAIIGAFSYNENIVSVKLPEGLVRLGEYSFKYCSALKSVSMPDTLEYIGETAFYNCREYCDVKIPGSVKVIESNAFEGTGYVNDVSKQEHGLLYCGDCLLNSYAIDENCEIKEGTRVIAAGAFSGRRNLKSVKFPKSLEYINRSAFYYCTALEELVIPANVKEIHGQAFFGCSGIKTLTFAEHCKLALIENEAFSNCSSLTAVNLPENVKRIGNSAFSGCGVLNDISLPKGIEYIGSDAFNDTWAYKDKNNWSSQMFYISDCLLQSDKMNVKSVKVREGTVCIADHAFAKAEYFEEIHIPATVKSIAPDAFWLQYKIKTIYFGGSEKEWEKVGKESVSFLQKVKIIYGTDSEPEHVHTFGEWKVTREPTCKERGKMTRTCTECGQKEVKYIAKTHVYEDGKCKYCGAKDPNFEQEESSAPQEESLPPQEESLPDDISEEMSEAVSHEEPDDGSQEQSSEELSYEETSLDTDENSEEAPQNEPVSEDAGSSNAESDQTDESGGIEISESASEETSVAEEETAESGSKQQDDSSQTGEAENGSGAWPLIVGGAALAAIAVTAAVIIKRRK